MFFLNRIVHIENIRLKPIGNVGVFTDDLCFDQMRLPFVGTRTVAESNKK